MNTRQELADIIAGRLSLALNGAGMSEQQLAARLGSRASRVNNWTRGRQPPSLLSIVQVADILDVSVDWLTGRRTRVGGGPMNRPADG